MLFLTLDYFKSLCYIIVNMSGNESILDKIIHQQRDYTLAEFNPFEVKKEILSHLKPRESDVLIKRFGLDGQERKTLEEIGNLYTITRERVRQIEITAIKKLLAINKNNALVDSPIKVITQILDENGGATEQDRLINQIIDLTSTKIEREVLQDKKELFSVKNFFIFGLNHLWVNNFKKISSDNDFCLGWRLSGHSVDLIKGLFAATIKIIDETGKPLSGKELIKKIKETVFWQEKYAPHLSAELDSGQVEHLILGQLALSLNIKANIFKEWGKNSWSLIRPKRMTDKIYLIFKQQHKPLHFRDITKYINDAKFDNKKAYPPTIHNELILDKRYVLIGRGIYALAEWGYFPGTVAEVIVKILKGGETPLTRDKIVELTLKQRWVNKATVHLALTNKELFIRQSNGTYGLIISK